MIYKPNLSRLTGIKDQSVSYFSTHTIFITVISLVTFCAIAIFLSGHPILKGTSAQKTTTKFAMSSPNPTPTAEVPTPTIKDVLGVSSYSYPGSYDAVSSTPFPTFAPIPLVPTYSPQQISTITNISSPPSCAGTAKDANSQVYVSSHTAVVGSTVTINVELRDCNNSLSSNDNLKITLQGNDATAKVNGQALPVTIQAENGKASFTVSSQTSGTDTFLITDTNQSFTVTEPGYHNLAITFGNNSSGNSNCTTVGGEPNSWYSDVYPASPVSAAVGSTVTFAVIIRDCNQNPVSSDSVSVSVSSGDPGTQINGGPNQTTFLVQNGQGSFTVTSAVAGTVGLTVTDITHSFRVTDTNNHNPSVVYSGSTSSSPTPTAIPTSSDIPAPTTTGIPPSPTPTPLTPTQTPAPTSGITPSPTSTH